MQRPSSSSQTTLDVVPNDNLVVFVPADSSTPPPADPSSTNATLAQQSPPQTIQFSDATTPEDYGAVQDKSFIVLDANAADEAGGEAGHEAVSMQNGGHEAIIVMESGEGDGQWYHDEDNHELKRVKVSFF
jgi:hypothetical protein